MFSYTCIKVCTKHIAGKGIYKVIVTHRRTDILIKEFPELILQKLKNNRNCYSNLGFSST